MNQVGKDNRELQSAARYKNGFNLPTKEMGSVGMSLEIGRNTAISTRNLQINYSHHSIASTNQNNTVFPKMKGIQPALFVSEGYSPYYLIMRYALLCFSV